MSAIHRLKPRRSRSDSTRPTRRERSRSTGTCRRRPDRALLTSRAEMARDWSDLFISGGAGAGETPTPEPETESGEPRAGRFRRLRDGLRRTRQALTSEIHSTLFDELDDQTW